MAIKKALTRHQILADLRRNQSILKRCKVRKIGLFGSFARNEQTSKSDIDFLVDFKEPTYDNLLELAEQLEKLYGRKVELVSHRYISKYIKPYVEKEVQWHEVQ